MNFQKTNSGWELTDNGKVLLRETAGRTVFRVGRGSGTVTAQRGNFIITDNGTDWRDLYATAVDPTETGAVLTFDGLTVTVGAEGDEATLTVSCTDETVNRFELNVEAERDEAVWGCGEQMSYFNLRGRTYPLWTGEPGVGRDKSTRITQMADAEIPGYGGDYYNTNFPQPVYLSSRKYYCNADSTAYAVFDFTAPDRHALVFWAVPSGVRFTAGATFADLVAKQTARYGRQPALPDWILQGTVLGLQGGENRVSEIIDRAQKAGVDVAAVWCQDWSGKRVTSFGKRVNWNWRADENTYPDLKAYIDDLHRRGVRFMAYVTPYLANDGDLYREGYDADVFIKTDDGGDFLIDFGEYDCGAVDLTDPRAVAWFQERILKQNMLALGIDGWMADFGEYQPAAGIVLADGTDPALAHNAWPVLWAKCNYGAVSECGRLGDAVYFMRSGGAGTGRYCTLLWAGDQSVDFSRHDGLCTVISGALSVGVSGVSYTHSDVGGYTSLYGNVRTKELFLRWAEMAAFTPVMRTHEGNRPAENYQVYDDPDGLARYAKLVKLHSGLLPYVKTLVAEQRETGLPLQRPLFFAYDEPFAYDEQFEYLYGRDLLVAPVWHPDVSAWEVRLPQDEWVHLWTGAPYGGGTFTVPAPLGEIPVFYRKASDFAPLFASLAEAYRQND